jgi:hypothetical protein
MRYRRVRSRRSNLTRMQRAMLDEAHCIEARERIMRMGAVSMMAQGEVDKAERIEAMSFLSQANALAEDAEAMRDKVWNPAPRKRRKKKA